MQRRRFLPWAAADKRVPRGPPFALFARRVVSGGERCAEGRP